MAEFINTQRPAWMHIDVPDPEPAYWDNFPHLLPEDITRYSYDYWAILLKGKYEAVPCDGCGQVVWERGWFWQGLLWEEDGTERYFGHLSFCLPCFKAARIMPRVVLDDGYELQFDWDMRNIVPSEGVLTYEFWRQKAQEEQEELARRFPPKTQQDFEAYAVAELEQVLQKVSPEKRQQAQGRPVMIRGVTVDVNAEGKVYVVPDSAERFQRMSEYLHALGRRNEPVK
jgi:hypothetical protein